MAEESFTTLEMLMRLISKSWMILLAPLPGVALKVYLEYRIHKRINMIQAFVSSLIGIILGWTVGVLVFAVFFDPKDVDGTISRALNFTIGSALITGLLGEKIALYIYENFGSIMDAFVSKFTGGKYKTKPNRTSKSTRRTIK